MGLFHTTPVSFDKIRTTRKKRSGVKTGSMPDDNMLGVEFDLPDAEPKKSYKNKFGGLTTVLEDGSVQIDLEPDKKKTSADDDTDHDANLAEFMEEFDLGMVAEDLLMGIEADLQSRGDMDSMAMKAIDLCGLKIEDAGDGSEGTVSKVHHSLLMESVVRYQSNAGGELLPAAGPVKVRDDTPPDAISTSGGILEGSPIAGIGHNGGPPLNAPGDEPGSELGGDAPPPIAGLAPSGGMTNVGGMGAALPANPLTVPKQEVDRTALAEALETDMNHYLTVVAKEYYPDYYRMLFAQGLFGCAFKKIFKCPLRRRPASDYISPLDLIVSNDATDLYTAGRVTHRTKMRQNIMTRMQYLGVYRDVSLSIPAEETAETEKKTKEVSGISSAQNSPLPRDQQFMLYECYTDLDLKGYEHMEDGEATGLPLPYRVTLEKDSRKILEIRRNWKEGDDTFTPLRRFVKYGLIPGLGFYDYGYMHLLGNTTKALTAAERMMLDAGMFANFPGMLIAKAGARQNTNILRIKPGTAKEIDTNGMPIKESVMELPYKDNSAGLLALAEAIAGDARSLSGLIDLPSGEGTQNIPVGTMLAMVEQATKVMGAIHKRNHASHQEELSILRELFAEDPECLWKFAKTPKRKWQMEMEFKDLMLVPASDPNVPSQIHRLMIGTALAQRAAAVPQLYNAREVEERLLRILGIQDIEQIMSPAPQPGAPPPEQSNPEAENIMLEAKAREGEQGREIQQEGVRAHLKITEKQLEMQDNAADRESAEKIAGLNLQEEVVKAHSGLQKDIISHATAKTKAAAPVIKKAAEPQKPVKKTGQKPKKDNQPA